MTLISNSFQHLIPFWICQHSELFHIRYLNSNNSFSNHNLLSCLSYQPAFLPLTSPVLWVLHFNLPIHPLLTPLLSLSNQYTIGHLNYLHSMLNKMPALEKLLYSTFSTMSVELSIEKSHKNILVVTTVVVSNHSRVLSTTYAFMVFCHLLFLFPQYSNSFPVSRSPISTYSLLRGLLYLEIWGHWVRFPSIILHSCYKFLYMHTHSYLLLFRCPGPYAQLSALLKTHYFSHARKLLFSFNDSHPFGL